MVALDTTRFSFVSTLSTNFPSKSVNRTTKPPSLSVSCSKSSSTDSNGDDSKRLSKQSSWETKDSEGNDYLYRLGKEADNMNIAVGARSGIIDDLFAGNFLGRDSDIVFDYRQKVTRSFEYLQGDYYIAPLFMVSLSSSFTDWIKLVSSMKLNKGEETVINFVKSVRDVGRKHCIVLTILPTVSSVFVTVCHIVKNYIAHLLNIKVPLILDVAPTLHDLSMYISIWGGKGQGKSFQTELIFQAMGIEPVIMSAGELESERAGEPGKLIRERYRTASQVVQNQVRSFSILTVGIYEGTEQEIIIEKDIARELALTYVQLVNHIQGKMSCLMINDIDAGLGRFGNTQMTVNNQIVVGTLMNLSDNPTRVSIGQDWRESDVTNRVPIICTGNDLSTIYAPLIRDGRMEKFFWQPNLEDIVNIVHRTYEKDGISRNEVISIVNTFPNQALDFYGALRSRTYDRSISKWIDDIGGVENLGRKLLKLKKDEKLPVFTPPEQTVEALFESGYSLLREQQLIMETKLSKEYMKNIDD
ncbi:hypothetical protein EZV62_004426 [Acer yangbiense]|uniref:Ribulose bisphosphate carboxylase/oxygenase activase, chloroplastic n=1 Tax=Acer yangbiense TaxID=1000413 RepID=A0A5C7IJW9_9ROSI|nr:hypothetical protein EZV62_004426 [Acer yangbiense]